MVQILSTQTLSYEKKKKKKKRNMQAFTLKNEKGNVIFLMTYAN